MKIENLRISGIILALLVMGSFTYSSVHAQDNTVNVYMDSTAQTIRGFGAAGIVGWRPNITTSELETAFGTGDGELGLSILRLRIPPQENHKEDQSAWSANLEVAQKAHEMGFTIIASPWTPPPSMKTNNDPVGGRLKEDAYDDFAEYLHDFGIYMAENGAPVYAISVQNEPDIQVSYESCDYSPQEMLTFMRDHADSITSTKVMAPESYQFRKQMSDPILNDSLATANTDFVAGHIYGNGNVRYPLAEEKGKELWMTEYLMGNESSGNLWDIAEQAGWVIHSSMEANFNAYLWWYMVRFYSVIHDGTDPIDDRFNDDASKGSVTKLGYVTSQFSRFVRPGLQRVQTDVPTGGGVAPLYITAYKDSANSKLVVVALNDQDADREINLVTEGSTPVLYQQYRTTEDLDAEQLEDIEVTGNAVTVTLPANSITTYVSDQITVSAEEDISSLPARYELQQNYPNPFNPNTVISYQIPVNSRVSLKVYDLLGREVATLVDERKAAGEHQVSLNASGFSSGVYIYRLKAGSFVNTKKMLLIK